MSVKRTKVTDGLFTSERVEIDLTEPMDDATFAELLARHDAGSVVGRIRWLEQYIAAQASPSPDVRLRLDKMREAIAVAKRNNTRDAVLMALEYAGMLWREIEALRFAQKGVRFSLGKPKGVAGPLRKLVRKMLASKRSRALKARELWDACKALPERSRGGIEFGLADAWIPDHGNATFRRFANIVSEEKKLLR